ncbi:MAG TPA: SufS family cysteine desulfurase [Tepiditoga sp.]|nr:SufS family cysteine desulfurase [Thermotogota bacterium]HOO74206.1 SufS family cysteine desulfurase [Tepiditoga sp.]
MSLFQKYRNDFPILDKNNIIYFDNAATTLKPKRVVDSFEKYYNNFNSNVHRSSHKLSAESTKIYENSRKNIADFINAESTDEIIFTKGTTEALNLISSSLIRSDLISEDESVLTTTLEHHANFVSWQQYGKIFGKNVHYYKNNNGIFNEDDFIKLIDKKTKVIAFTALTNVTGQVTDIGKIINSARNINKNIIIVIDGAQYVPHFKTDVRKYDIDFIAFSGHKMLGPMGTGVLYGKKNILKKLPPYMFGGEMIDSVTTEDTTFNIIPFKFETGTPDVAGFYGLSEAINYMNETGTDKIHERVKELTMYALEKLKTLDFLDLYGTLDENQHSIVSFNVKDIHPHDVSQFLNDSDGIAIRSGHHCAQPFHKELGIYSSCRASFNFYNTEEEIDTLYDALLKIRRWFK